MRLIGCRVAGVTYVAAKTTTEDKAVLLAPVEEFWEDPFSHLAACAGEREVVDLGDTPVVPPVRDSARILCVGLNYAEHVAEGPFSTPDYPTVFGRWTPSLAVSGNEVVVPVDEEGLDWEAELLAVVGRPLSVATASEARDAIFAYGVFNDITARRAQKLTTQWTIGKNVDNSGAMSDLITIDEAPDPEAGLRICAWVNGELTQDARTDQMIFTVPDLLAFLSRSFELRPGDLVATGTPSGVGYARTPAWLLHPGDHVVAEVEGIGSATTVVIAAAGA